MLINLKFDPKREEIVLSSDSEAEEEKPSLTRAPHAPLAERKLNEEIDVLLTRFDSISEVKQF